MSDSSIRMNFSHGRSSLIEFNSDVTFKDYSQIGDIKRSNAFHYIHVGVGNPVGGWAIRISESPSQKPNPYEIPEGIWIHEELFDSFRSAINRLRIFFEQIRAVVPPSEREELLPFEIVPKHNSDQIMFTTLVQCIESQWFMVVMDTRGHEIAMDESEFDQLCNLLAKARPILSKKIHQRISFQPFFPKVHRPSK